MGTYKMFSFPGGSNIHINLITREKKIIITNNLRISLVPYVSPKSNNGYNGGDDLPTFIMSRHKRIRTKVSKKL